MRKLWVLIGCLLITIGLLYTDYRSTVESMETIDEKHPIATIYLSNKMQLKIALYPEEAPNTVRNFMYLATNHFYDNMKFSRLVPNYLMQAGDPLYNGFGFPGYFIKSECKANGFKNHLKHKRGTISMARGDLFNTEGSQFFVLLKDDSALDGQYAAFGQVIAGLETLEQAVTTQQKALSELEISKITIETFGVFYETPTILSIDEQRKLQP